VHVIELFTSRHCLASPAAQQALERFCAEWQSLCVRQFDVSEALAAARRYGLFATPAIVIDGQHVLYGVPRPEVLRRYLAGPGP
jgi:hypothetical protein